METPQAIPAVFQPYFPIPGSLRFGRGQRILALSDTLQGTTILKHRRNMGYIAKKIAYRYMYMYMYK